MCRYRRENRDETSHSADPATPALPVRLGSAGGAASGHDDVLHRLRAGGRYCPGREARRRRSG
ncbi:protein of unknown function [Streptomyces murinus]